MSTSFYIWDAQKPDDFTAWESLWKSWSSREVFAHPAYGPLYQKPGVRFLCAAMITDDGSVLYPFYLRDLTCEDYCPARLGSIYDLCTPYGYGGPFCWESADRAKLSEQFWFQFNAWATGQSIVSEIIRFHLFPESLLPYPGEREELFRNIVCDLTPSEEELWMRFEHKVRKNVKKAQRSNVTVIQDAKGDRLEEFLRIYYGTMERREASDSFFFEKEYFKQIEARLAGQWTYFHSIHEGRVISTELVLVSAENIYSFLGGTDASGYDLRPNDLLKYEIIRWAKQQGKKRFVLGGGYGGEDGIFRYKQSFAPAGSVPFFIGKRILRNDLYQQLVEAKKIAFVQSGQEWIPRARFFPLYRA